MDIKEITIPLYDLAAAATTGTFDTRLAYLTKAQKFTLGAAAVGTDLNIVDGAPAAGEIQLTTSTEITLGDAIVAGVMITLTGVPIDAVPQI